MFPSDEEIQENDIEEGSRFFVRITDLPLQDKLRELRCVLWWCLHSSADATSHMKRDDLKFQRGLSLHFGRQHTCIAVVPHSIY